MRNFGTSLGGKVGPAEKRDLWILALLLVGIVAIYSITINGPFVYDDIPQIGNNEQIHHLANFKGIFFYAGRATRPLLNILYALAWSVAPYKTWPFHVQLILLHLANTALVFRLLKKILPTDLANRSVVVWGSVTLFAFHPLQVQGISYVMGAISSVQCLFYLACLNLYDSKSTKNNWKIRFILGISMLCKESCLLITPVLVWYDLTLGGLTWKSLPYRRHLSFICSSLAVMLPLYLLVSNPVSAYDDSTGFNLYPYGQYIVTQGYYYLFYMRMFLDSSIQSLIHPFPKFSSSILIQGIVGWGVCVGAVIAAFYFKLKRPVFSFFVGFFFISLLLTNTFLEMSNPFAEYRLYQPDLSIFIALAYLLSLAIAFVEKPILKYIALTVPLLWVLCSGFLMQQVWKTDIGIYIYSQSVYPESHELAQMVGTYYEALNKYTLAEEQYQKALVLFNENHGPVYLHPYRMLFRIYMHSGQWDKALNTIEIIEKDLSGGKLSAEGYRSYLEILRMKDDRERYDEIRKKAADFYPSQPLPTWDEEKKAKAFK